MRDQNKRLFRGKTVGRELLLTKCTFPVLYPVLAPERGPEWQTHARRRNLGRVLSESGGGEGRAASGVR